MTAGCYVPDPFAILIIFYHAVKFRGVVVIDYNRNKRIQMVEAFFAKQISGKIGVSSFLKIKDFFLYYHASIRLMLKVFLNFSLNIKQCFLYRKSNSIKLNIIRIKKCLITQYELLYVPYLPFHLLIIQLHRYTNHLLLYPKTVSPATLVWAEPSSCYRQRCVCNSL